MPFLLKLRSFVRDGSLQMPGAEEFTTATGSTLAGEQPDGWVTRHLDDGSAVVLVDGIDELPAEHRPAALEWLEQLCGDYPAARYVTTSRPGVLTPGWRDRLIRAGFKFTQLQPMTPGGVRECVIRWHRAQQHRGGDPEELRSQADDLIKALEARRDLTCLATTPLLCALVCALHRNSDGVLPEGRNALYRATLTMMLGSREQARGVKASRVRLSSDNAERLLGVIAQWMTINGRRSVPRDTAVAILEPELRYFAHKDTDPHTAGELLDHLLGRSGLLHEPEVDVIEFRHASFQDYLAAWEMVQARHIDHLLKNAHDPLYHDVIIMAVGRTQNSPDIQSALLGELTKRARQEGNRALWLLAAAAVADTGMVNADLRDVILDQTRALLPPTSLEQADEIARAGEFIVDLLFDYVNANPLDNEPTIACCIISAAVLAGVDTAVPLLRRLRNHPHTDVRTQVVSVMGWVSDRDRYIEEVILNMNLDGVDLTVRDAELLDRHPALLIHVTRVLDFDGENLDRILQAPRLVELELNDPFVQIDMTLFRRAPHLRALRIDADAGADLSPLATLTELETLTLTSRSIVDVGPLGALTALTTLLLRGTGVSDVRPLAVLDRLRTLDLSKTPVTDLTPQRVNTELNVLLFDCAKLISNEANQWFLDRQSGLVLQSDSGLIHEGLLERQLHDMEYETEETDPRPE